MPILADKPGEPRTAACESARLGIQVNPTSPTRADFCDFRGVRARQVTDFIGLSVRESVVVPTKAL
ncbi:hypothetical protein, partial [Roseiarcus sp.]|uniref:hypothetical protein n=1 Tax=Roseiarcus sp. TaxID=1969460 RepID=UPI003F9C5DC9